MITEVLYQYMGTNGIITSPVHLEDIYYIRLIRLIADDGKQLTKDGVMFCQSTTVPEADASQWYEVSR